MNKLPTFRTCTRCGEVKTRASFPVVGKSKDRLGSHCRECRLAVSRESRKKYDHDRHYWQQFRGPYADPVRFGRGVADHIALYVAEAIKRFETRTGKEAPPHLRALLESAENARSELNPPTSKPKLVKRCRECGDEYGTYRRDSIYCSHRCYSKAWVRRKAQDPEWRANYNSRRRYRRRLSTGQSADK